LSKTLDNGKIYGMETQQKALYNSLRLTWLQEQSLSIEPWKVEDLRAVDLETLFQRLQERELYMDRATFKNYADQSENPEVLTEELIMDQELSPEEQDQVYLIVFELWRRLSPEKPSISILLDELDHQIFLYDQGQSQGDALEEALFQLHEVLEENVDAGIVPKEAFSAISEYAASNIEEFLCDYIAEKIETKDTGSAEELLEKFTPFMEDVRWFRLLEARLLVEKDEQQAVKIIEAVFLSNNKLDALDLDFEMLSILVQGGNEALFFKIAHHALRHIEFEEDFIELLYTVADFFRCSDDEEKQAAVEALIEAREATPRHFTPKDTDVASFTELLK